MKPQKTYEIQNNGHVPFVIVVFILVAASALLLTFFCFTNDTLTMPNPEDKNPKEVNLVTMEMDFATIYKALDSDRCSWANVNNPKGIFYHPIQLTPKQEDIESFVRVIPEQLAARTAERYPHLFKYDNEKKEFTLIVTDPKKQFIVMPAWLVANMIEAGTLQLP